MMKMINVNNFAVKMTICPGIAVSWSDRTNIL